MKFSNLNIDPKAITNLIILIVALANAILDILGKPLIQLPDENIETLVTTVFLVGSSLFNHWVNNNYTKEAQETQQILDVKKAEKKIKKAKTEPPTLQEAVEDVADIAEIPTNESAIEREVDNRGI